MSFLSFLRMADSLRKTLLCSSLVRRRFSLLGPFVNIIKNLILQRTGNVENQIDGCFVLRGWFLRELKESFTTPPPFFFASLILTATSSHRPDSLFCLALPLLQGCSGSCVTEQASSPSLTGLLGLLDEPAVSARVVVPVNGSGAVHFLFVLLTLFLCDCSYAKSANTVE